MRRRFLSMAALAALLLPGSGCMINQYSSDPLVRCDHLAGDRGLASCGRALQARDQNMPGARTDHFDFVAATAKRPRQFARSAYLNGCNQAAFDRDKTMTLERAITDQSVRPGPEPHARAITKLGWGWCDQIAAVKLDAEPTAKLRHE